jgi:DNA replication and repair protein RecF
MPCCENGATSAELSAWDAELAPAALALNAAACATLDALTPVLLERLRALLPDLGEPCFQYLPGWNTERDLGLALSDSHGTDRQRGHTTRGPHRADWKLSFELAPRREQLSRGQEKLCAIGCMLAQAQLYHADHGEMAGCLAGRSAVRIGPRASACRCRGPDREAAQVFLSSTEMPACLLDVAAPYRSFHVEQGRVSALL